MSGSGLKICFGRLRPGGLVPENSRACMRSSSVDAYPTTYRRPDVPYTAASITAGSARYDEQCAPCHGHDGRGDGPRGRGLPRPSAIVFVAPPLFCSGPKSGS